MNIKTIIPAIPGTVVIWYNHCHESTQAEYVIAWGLADDGETPFLAPFVVNLLTGSGMMLELPERNDFSMSDSRYGTESSVIAFEIPGVGRISANERSKVYGEFIKQVAGFDPAMSVYFEKQNEK